MTANRNQSNTGLGSYDYDAGIEDSRVQSGRLDESENKGLIGQIAQDAVEPNSFNDEMDDLEKQFEDAVSPEPTKPRIRKKKVIKRRKTKKATGELDS